jgi:hypothetical protein
VNGPRGMTEWLVVAVLVAAFVGVLLYLNWRAGRIRPFRSFTLHGPAVTPEMELVFGAYGQGGVEGLIVLNDGIRVSYKGSASVRFVPLPDGSTLYVNEDGEFVADPPAVVP